MDAARSAWKRCSRLIEELESRYGVPSERRREAIEGELCESEDLFLRDALVLSRDRMTGMTVDIAPDKPAEPKWLAANLTRDGAAFWRYCRNRLA